MNISLRECLIATILGLLLLISNFSVAYAHPLRIWVMPNEPKHLENNLTQKNVTSFISKLKNESGIVIENNPYDFLLPSQQGGDFPLGNHVIWQSQFIDELKRFQKESKTNETIVIEIIRWQNAFNRLTSAIEQKEIDKLPDIVQIGTTWTAYFANKGALLNIKGEIDENAFFDHALKSVKPHKMGGVFAAPWFVETRIVFYHKDKVKNGNSIFQNTHSFIKNCPEILKEHPEIDAVIAFPIGSKWDLLHNLSPWLWGEGGDILEVKSLGGIPFHSVKLDSRESLKAITYLHNLSQNGSALVPSINLETLETEFIKGHYASIITGPWFISRLKKGWYKKIGVSLLPAGSHGSHPFIGGSNLGIWHATKERGNFKRAIELVKFLTSSSSQSRYSDATSFLPARNSEMEHYFRKPGMRVFQEALNKGKSYPSIPEWGELVENELIRDHIWQIWEQIAQRKPLEIVHQTTINAANSLRKKIIITAIDKSSFYFGGVLIGLLSVGSLIFIKTKRRYRSLQERYVQNMLQMENILGEHKILKAKRAALIKWGNSQKDKLNNLERKITTLTQKETNLNSTIAQLRSQQLKLTFQSFDDLNIHWDGTVFVKSKKLEFENNKQAKRLIEHITRCATKGIRSVHCIIGYPLFSWDSKQLKSSPNHLFKIAATKINSTLKRNGLPPILVRENRNSWRWLISWDKKTLLEHSSAGEASKQFNQSVEAKESLSIDDINTLLHKDPKCLEIYSHLPTLFNSAKDRQKFRFGITLLEAEARQWQDGTDQAKKFVEANAPISTSELDSIQNVLADFEHHTNYLKQILDYINFSAPAPTQTLRITDQIEVIRKQISTAQKDGENEIGVWATAIQSEDFSELLSIPKIHNIINNVYNPDIQSKEDPNLVQLALLKACSSEEIVAKLKKTENDNHLFKEIDKQIRIQLKALENEFGTMPEY
ncbi:MAG: extracellular solute-binding protein [Pseudomonadota bacterium]